VSLFSKYFCVISVQLFLWCLILMIVNWHYLQLFISLNHFFSINTSHMSKVLFASSTVNSSAIINV
jgi:hypothetical protein